MTREVVIVETTEAGAVSVLGRSRDPELVERVSHDLAAAERRRLARLEGRLRLVPDPTADPAA